MECEAENILEYLQQAKQVKLFGEYYSFFLTSLNAHTVDLSEFKFNLMNITMLRLVDPNREVVTDAIKDWSQKQLLAGDKLNFTAKTVRVETALMYDAVHLFAKALHHLNLVQPISVRKMSCNITERWQHGQALWSFMRMVNFEGMSGVLKFDDDGRRTDFHLDVVELAYHDVRSIGSWELSRGAIGIRSQQEVEETTFQNMQNKTFIVSSRIGMPYLGWKFPREGRVGNDRFQGYSFDLITKIAEILNFKFEFRLTSDGNYGNLDPKTKKWNGLIRDLLKKKADLAICDLTITFEREQVVDFTMPFMTLGISILYSKPVEHDPGLLAFLDPLSIVVWLSMATAFLGMSVMFFFLARMNPNEWINPHPCNSCPKKLVNNFNMANCMWVSIRFLMKTGCDILPKAVSTRALAAVWWFFSLIMISSYTANLAASLTVTRMEETIESVEDLAKQTKIKYGAVHEGSTAGFFEKSNHSTYARLWSVMTQARPNVFVKDNAAGVERVRKSKRKYAFFMESTQIEYSAEMDCNLTQIGRLLDTKGYGIALRHNSPYRTLISRAVLRLQESGELQSLKHKWWRQMNGGGKCNVGAPAKGSSSELGMSNVGGVFLVLLTGTASGLVVSIIELLWNCRKIAVEEAITPWEALVLEMKFVIRISKTKPIRRKTEGIKTRKKLLRSLDPPEERRKEEDLRKPPEEHPLQDIIKVADTNVTN